MGVIDDILGKEPEQRTVEFCTDRKLREALSTAQGDLERAKRRADQARTADKDRVDEVRGEVADLEEKVAELVEQVQEKMVRFTFAALDDEEFDRLKGEHRPTSKQLTAARQAKEPQPEWNPDTLPPVLVAAACIKVESPSGSVEGLSVEDAEAIWKSRAYNEAERSELFHTALGATLTRTRIDLPKDG